MEQESRDDRVLNDKQRVNERAIQSHAASIFTSTSSPYHLRLREVSKVLFGVSFELRALEPPTFSETELRIIVPWDVIQDRTRSALESQDLELLLIQVSRSKATSNVSMTSLHDSHTSV